MGDCEIASLVGRIHSPGATSGLSGFSPSEYWLYKMEMSFGAALCAHQSMSEKSQNESTVSISEFSVLDGTYSALEHAQTSVLLQDLPSSGAWRPEQIHGITAHPGMGSWVTSWPRAAP